MNEFLPVNSDNLDEMDKFLERPKLTQKETGNPNSLESIKEIEFVVKNFPTKKLQFLMAPVVNSTKH